MEQLKSCVAVDPSINNLGIAIFSKNVLISYHLIHPNRENQEATYLVKARDMCNKVRTVFNQCIQADPLMVLVTEVPEHFGTSGYISRETGSVFKLTFVCGMIYGIAENTIAYRPSIWKGQMSKEIVRNRLVKDYPNKGFETLDHNIIDAIGIGHKYIFGKV